MADRIQELISSQKELTHAISHELRTPISRTRFSLEMLENSTKETERKRYMVEIKKDIDELEELVSEVLTYANLDQEIPRLCLEEQPIVPLIERVVELEQSSHPRIQVTFRQLLDQTESIVAFEPRFMERALGNLMQNGFQYAKERIQVIIEREGLHCVIQVIGDVRAESA